MNGKRFYFYSKSIQELIDFDKEMDKGIIPNKNDYTKEEFNDFKLENLNKETVSWKWIKGYEGLYAVSEYGNVVSFWKSKFGDLMSLTNKKNWYLSFRAFDRNKKYKTLRVHVVVAETFIGEVPKGYHVHHKDGNKQNNSVQNLEILSAREHCLETIKKNPHVLDGMISYNKGKQVSNVKNKRKQGFKLNRFPKGKILQFTLDGEFVAEYYNAMDASRETGVCSRNILQVANKEPFNKSGNVRKQAGGYIWKFESEVI